MTITMLFTSLCMGMFADDVTGIAPAAGESCYLYNVGQGKYLAASADGFTLSENGTQFTLSAVQGISGCYRLTDGSAVVFSTSFNSPVFFGSAGEFDIWRFSNVSGTDTYNLGCLERDAFSYSQVYWSDVTASLEKTQLLSMMENSLWKLVGDISVVDPDPENPVDPDPEYVTEVVFDENDTEFVLPENMADTVTVKYYRTAMKAGQKTGVCFPFHISNEQIKAAFGKSAVVREYYGHNGGNIKLRTVSQMQPGVPYVVTPSTTVIEGYYQFDNVISASFVDEPVDVINGDYTFKGTFAVTEVPAVFYGYTSGSLKRFTTSRTIMGCRSYFVINSANAAPIVGEFYDDADGVSSVLADGKSDAIFNISGQIVRQNATTTEGLPKGVYLIHGKKFVVK